MKEKILAQIQHLHDVLEGCAVDECTAADLKQITGDIRSTVDEAVSGQISPEPAGFGEDLEREALKFSDEHPAVATVIREIIHTLHNAGI